MAKENSRKINKPTDTAGENSWEVGLKLEIGLPSLNSAQLFRSAIILMLPKWINTIYGICISEAKYCYLQRGRESLSGLCVLLNINDPILRIVCYLN